MPVTVHYLDGGPPNPSFSPRPRYFSKRKYVPPLDLRHMANSSENSPSGRHQSSEAAPLFPPATDRSQYCYTTSRYDGPKTASSLARKFGCKAAGVLSKNQYITRSTSPIHVHSSTNAEVSSPNLADRDDRLYQKFISSNRHSTRRAGQTLNISDVVSTNPKESSLPDSLLPESVHVYESTVTSTADDYDPADIMIKDGELKRRVFPTNTTSELRKRDQALFLVGAVKELVQNVQTDDPSLTLENERELLFTSGREIVRQVTVECAERGSLLNALLDRYHALTGAAPKILGIANDEVQKRSKMLVDLKESFQNYQSNLIDIAKKREEELLSLIHHLEKHLEAFDEDLSRLRSNIVESQSKSSNATSAAQFIPHPVAVLLGQPVPCAKSSDIKFSDRFINRIALNLLNSHLSCVNYSTAIKSNLSSTFVPSLKYFYGASAPLIMHSMNRNLSGTSKACCLVRKLFNLPLIPQVQDSNALPAVVASLVVQWCCFGLRKAPVFEGTLVPIGCEPSRVVAVFKCIIGEQSSELSSLTSNLVDFDSTFVKFLGCGSELVPILHIASNAFDSVKATGIDSRCLPLPPETFDHPVINDVDFTDFAWPDSSNIYIRKAKLAASFDLCGLAVGYLRAGLAEAAGNLEFSLVNLFTNLLTNLNKIATVPQEDSVVSNCNVLFKLQRSIRKYVKRKRN
ncbi:hypothetical protein P9112_011490 [Eukaryota sp. TZLM1-RC]